MTETGSERDPYEHEHEPGLRPRPDARDDEGRMLYRSYALINFFARSDQDAANLIDRAERALDALADPDRGEAIDAVLTDEVYKGEFGEHQVTLPDPEPPACARCGSPVSDERCTDETCPFSDCPQDDPRGWSGHPEPAGHPVTRSDLTIPEDALASIERALRFYADPATYEEKEPVPGELDGQVDISDDGGFIAREAVTQLDQLKRGA